MLADSYLEEDNENVSLEKKRNLDTITSSKSNFHRKSSTLHEIAINSLPKDRGWAWMVALGCFIQNIFTIGTVVKTFGILYVAIMEQFNSDAGSAAWIVVLTNSSLTMIGLFTNALARRFTARLIIVLGGIIVSLGYITSMFAQRLEHLFLTYGIICGVGCAFAWSPSVSHMGLYFQRYRAIANGLAFSGVGIGNLIMPIILRILLDAYGVQGALLVMGALTLHICVGGFLHRPVTAYTHSQHKSVNVIYKPSNIEMKDLNNMEKEQQDTEGSVCSKSNIDWSLLKKPSFIIFCLFVMLFMAGYPAYIIIIPPYAKEIELSKASAAYLLSISGTAELIGRVVICMIADRNLIPTRILMGLCVLLGAISAFVTPFVNNFYVLACFVFIYTFFTGPIMPLMPVLIAETYGVSKLSDAMGFAGVSMGIGLLASGPVAGSLKDHFGTWKYSFFYLSCILFTAALISFIKPIANKLERRKSNVGNSTHI